MKLSETSIRRPVLASMFSAALVLFGVIGYTRLSVRELPDIDPPIISVSTTLPGANAQVVETAVTDVLEEELSTIQGLRTLSSSSSEENSEITLEFNLDRAVDVAAQDVRDKVSRVRGRLPVDVLEPVIAKQSADAQPFFWLALSSDNYDLMQLSDVADRLVKARLQSLPGVGSAGIFGERRYSMRVWVQPDALSAAVCGRTGRRRWRDGGSEALRGGAEGRGGGCGLGRGATRSPGGSEASARAAWIRSGPRGFRHCARLSRSRRPAR